MTLKIENASGAPLEINDLGISLDIGEITDIISRAEARSIVSSTLPGEELYTLIQSGNVVIKDPIDNITNLSASDGIAACMSLADTNWRVGKGARLRDISDVSISNALDGYVLTFNINTNKWEPAAPTTTATTTRNITQIAHGFTIPTSGILPLAYDTITEKYILASAANISTIATVFAVGIPNANTITIQEGGLLYRPSHGLTVGRWYVLSNTVPGNMVLLNAFSGQNRQHLVFVVDSNILILRMDTFFSTYIPVNIAVVNDWTQGTNPVLSAGVNRFLIAGVTWEELGANTFVSSIVVGGQTGTVLVSQTITSGGQFGITYYYFKEAQIAAMSGNTLTVNWSAGAPDTSRTSTILLQHVDQTSPVVAINTDSGTGSPDTLDADTNTLVGGYIMLAAGGGRDDVGFTNNSSGWTRRLNLTGMSGCDGVVDDKLITSAATPENANITITGSNRQAMVVASIRRKES